MIIPVRCFTCNKVIGHMWNDYCDIVEEQRKLLGNDSDTTPERFSNKYRFGSVGSGQVLLQENASYSC